MMRPIVLAICVFSIFSSISLSAGHCQLIHNEIDEVYYQEPISLRSLMQKYIASIIPGIIIGGNAGLIGALMDHLLPGGWPLWWVGTYLFRSKALEDMHEDYQRRHIPHDKIIMECSALASTWGMYYKIYQTLHGSPPF